MTLARGCGGISAANARRLLGVHGLVESVWEAPNTTLERPAASFGSRLAPVLAVTSRSSAAAAQRERSPDTTTLDEVPLSRKEGRDLRPQRPERKVMAYGSPHL